MVFVYFCRSKKRACHTMLQITVNDNTNYTIEHKDDQWFINDTPGNWGARMQPNGLISILYNGKSYTAIVENVDTKNKVLTLRIDGQTQKITIKEPIDQLLSSMGLDLKAMQKVEP